MATAPLWVRPDVNTQTFVPPSPLPVLSRAQAVYITDQPTMDAVTQSAAQNGVGLEFYSSDPGPAAIAASGQLPYLTAAALANVLTVSTDGTRPAGAGKVLYELVTPVAPVNGDIFIH